MFFRSITLFAILVGLNSCGKPQDISDLSDTESLLLNQGRRIFILGIHGRGTPTKEIGEKDYEHSGVSVLIDKIKAKLAGLDIPDSNIRKLQWNADYQSPFKEPDVEYIENQMPDLYFEEPVYTAMIGHSYGGFAAGRVSESFTMQQGKVPDYLATIDPVHGYRNNAEVDYFAETKNNWYQTNGITPFSSSLCLFDNYSCRRSNGISCGRDLSEYGFDAITKLNVQSRADGSKKSMRCLGLEFDRPQVHTSIDGDEYVHEQIINQVVNDVIRVLAIENS